MLWKDALSWRKKGAVTILTQSVWVSFKVGGLGRGEKDWPTGRRMKNVKGKTRTNSGQHDSKELSFSNFRFIFHYCTYVLFYVLRPTNEMNNIFKGDYWRLLLVVQKLIFHFIEELELFSRSITTSPDNFQYPLPQVNFGQS